MVPLWGKQIRIISRNPGVFFPSLHCSRWYIESLSEYLWEIVSRRVHEFFTLFEMFLIFFDSVRTELCGNFHISFFLCGQLEKYLSYFGSIHIFSIYGLSCTKIGWMMCCVCSSNILYACAELEKEKRCVINWLGRDMRIIDHARDNRRAVLHRPLHCGWILLTWLQIKRIWLLW